MTAAIPTRLSLKARIVCFVRAAVAYARLEPLECLGALAGGFGALLLSQNSIHSKWGWVGFLLSNMFFLAMSYQKKLYGLLLVQGYFFYTSLNGIFHYF